MVYIFEKVEQEPKAMTMTGATHTVSLDENVDYLMLLLRFKWTAGVSQIDALKERILDWLSSITIIGDDDKYVVNNSARELAALHFYRTKRPVSELVDNKNLSVSVLELPIYFGRYFGDTEYFLKRGMFSKLEVNIKNDDSATGNFFNAGTCEIRSYQLKDHAIVPVGVLRSKEVKSWAPESATASYTEELPDKHKIEKILVEAQPSYVSRTSNLAAEYSVLVDRLKLTYKGGDIVPFDDDIEELAWRNSLVYGLARTNGYFTGFDNDYWDTGLGYRTAAQISPSQDPAAGYVEGILKGTTQRALLKVESTTAADHDRSIHAEGYAYLDTVLFDFAPDRDMRNLYDPAMYKKAELKITAGHIAGKVNISVVELVTAF